MKKRIKHSLLVGATAASLGLAAITGIGMASAASNSSGQTSLIDQIASKFNLNRDQVAAVFTADRAQHHAQMQADQAKRLAQVVTDGKLTQAQADYITGAQREIDNLMSSADPGQESDATRASIRQKIDTLRTWAKDNNIDQQYVGPGGPGMGGPGGAYPIH
jgi:hypothetical protein